MSQLMETLFDLMNGPHSSEAERRAVRESAKAIQAVKDRLGKVLGVKQDAISTYERGKFYPEVRNLLILADHFGVSLDYLMGRTDDPEVHQLEPR